MDKQHSYSCEYPEGCSCGASEFNQLIKERDELRAQLDINKTLNAAFDDYMNHVKQERDKLREQLATANHCCIGSIENNKVLQEQLATARTALEDNIEVLQDCQQSLQEFRCLSDDVYDAMPARVFEVERAIKQSQTALAQIAAPVVADSAISESGQVWGGAEL